MNTCLITGASGGVATALASRLREAGWRLALVTRQPDKLQPDEADLVIEADVSTAAGADHAAGRPLVLDHDGLAQLPLQLVGHQAAHGVDRATRRVRNHHADRLARIVLRAHQGAGGPGRTGHGELPGFPDGGCGRVDGHLCLLSTVSVRRIPEGAGCLAGKGWPRRRTRGA